MLLIAAVYPDLTPRQLEVPLSYINSSLGLQLDAAAVTKLLHSMQLDVAPEPSSSSSSSSGPVLIVRVPPTRSDILHACDVMEDVAIAYGYNNLQQQVGRVILLWGFGNGGGARGVGGVISHFYDPVCMLVTLWRGQAPRATLWCGCISLLLP
jgi:hypothetical protein